jgi:hypothetical protein
VITSTEYVRLAVVPTSSVTRTSNDDLPFVDGAPENRPSGRSCSPRGRVPYATMAVSGHSPPSVTMRAS